MKFIGFEKTNNFDKLALPDTVEIDSLIMAKNCLIKKKNRARLRDKSFWSCKRCSHDNPFDSKTCRICGLPAEVCIF